MGTITSANAVLTLGVIGLFDTPQVMQGFATDDAWTSEAIECVQTVMGVDGLLSAGFTPKEVKFDVTLQADSASQSFFDTWFAIMQQQQEALEGFGSLRVPSTGRVYQFVTGFLTSYKPTPDGKAILQPRKFGLTWQAVTLAPT